MVVYTLLIINKAGGLIYNRTFNPSLSQLSTNDYLILAGTFHGVHAITRSLTPSAITSSLAPPPSSSGGSSDASIPAPQVRPSGLEVLETALFRMTCFQTFSGTKFLLFTEPTQPNVEAIIKRIYELYVDYVMRNPFYGMEMPVRCDAFERVLAAYVRAK